MHRELYEYDVLAKGNNEGTSEQKFIDLFISAKGIEDYYDK